jgi:hypothetical protein
MFRGVNWELRMSTWANFYRGLANEARERALEATNLSKKEKLDEVAREWSELADWAERRDTVSVLAN